MGPDIKELQIPSVECKLSCKQQKVGRDFCQRRVARIGFVILEGKPEVGCSPAHCARWETNQVGEQWEADRIGAGAVAMPGRWCLLDHRL